MIDSCISLYNLLLVRLKVVMHLQTAREGELDITFGLSTTGVSVTLVTPYTVMYSHVRITQQARIFRQKIDEIWPNSASQKIPGLLSYTYQFFEI